ncbi:MAG: hypothetical protein U1F36_20095 [Planctomycetota bacterium]
MSAIPLLLCLVSLQQPGALQTASKEPARQVGPLVGVVSDAVRAGVIDLTRLGLGDGGIAAERHEPNLERDGTYRTAGGVVVQVRPVGVKLDFPSGADLVVDAEGALHLRGGEDTAAHRSGLRIVLADGAVIEIVPHGAADRPPRHVEVREGDRASVLFRSGGVLTWSREAREVREVVLFVLGDGRMVYRAGQLGPLLGFERVLCPADRAARTPPTALLLPADVLVPSLFDLTVATRRQAPGDMDLQRQADALASVAPNLFPFGEKRLRPEGATGEFLIPLSDGFHLKVEPRDGGFVAVDLWYADHDAPECEWIAGSATYLHMFKRSTDGRLRYAMQGLDLRGRLTGLLPGGRIAGGDALVRKLVGEQVAAGHRLPVTTADRVPR